MCSFTLKSESSIVLATQNGAIAQLGERNTGSVEVSGSIPLSSTNFIWQPVVLKKDNGSLL